MNGTSEEWITKLAQSKRKLGSSAENIYAIKRLLKIKTFKTTLHHYSYHFVSDGFEKVAWAVRASQEKSLLKKLYTAYMGV